MRELQTNDRINNIYPGDNTLPSQLTVETAMHAAVVPGGQPQVDSITTCLILDTPTDKYG